MSESFFTDTELIPFKKNGKTFTIALQRSERDFVLFTDEELYAAKGGILVLDEEVYRNYYLAAFRCFNTDKVVYFEKYEGVNFNFHKLLWILHNFTIVTFNGNNYDIPMIWLALQGVNNETLKNVSDFIIKGNWRPQDVEKAYGFKMGQINHIDLIEVAPGKGSLKAYMSRLNAKRLQDLPFDPDTILTLSEIKAVCLYCINDLEGTILLLKDLSPQLELRAQLSKDYGLDLRSKSDAQIAEAVIISEVKKLTGIVPQRPKIETGTIFRYSLPDHIRFQDPKLNEMLFEVANAPFEIGLSKKEGQIVLSPKELEGRIVKIGGMEYRLGIGGIHSTEKSTAHIADDNTILADVDVESEYPRLILNQCLYPEQVGPVFLDIFNNLVESRLHDKHSGNKVGSDSKKIVINATYGKLNDNWSRLRSPGNMIQVTVSCQLSLLMLIESAELSGIPAVSANTDGVVFKCPVEKYDTLKAIVSEWENITRFKTEETRYKAIYSANVNNYLAVKLDGKLKAKGWYGEVNIKKNPTSLICVEAVKALIVGNTPIEETITSCKDLNMFVTCRNVKGGACKNYKVLPLPEHKTKEEIIKMAGFVEFYGDTWKLPNQSDMSAIDINDAYEESKRILAKYEETVYLGKIVRWIYTKDEQGTINYITSGNKVPQTDGATPLMDMPDKFPDNLDYERYIKETVDILFNLGYYQREEQIKFF